MSFFFFFFDKYVSRLDDPTHFFFFLTAVPYKPMYTHPHVSLQRAWICHLVQGLWPCWRSGRAQQLQCSLLGGCPALGIWCCEFARFSSFSTMSSALSLCPSDSRAKWQQGKVTEGHYLSIASCDRGPLSGQSEGWPLNLAWLDLSFFFSVCFFFFLCFFSILFRSMAFLYAVLSFVSDFYYGYLVTAHYYCYYCSLGYNGQTYSS